MAGSPAIEAANRIFIPNQTVKVGDVGVAIEVRGDTDQIRHGFSLSIKYDQAKLNVKAVEIAGTVSAVAQATGWSGGVIVADKGAISWGVVLDLEPPLTDVIPIGNNHLLVNLRADVLAAAATTAAVTPQNGLIPPPEPQGRWTNILSYQGVNTQPVLVGGTITIEAAPPPGNRFQLGDCSGDKGAIPDLTDAIYLLSFLFTGGPLPPCDAACDSNSDGRGDVSDAVFVLNYLFLGGEPPKNPFPACDRAPAAACGADICGV